MIEKDKLPITLSPQVLDMKTQGINLKGDTLGAQRGSGEHLLVFLRHQG